MEAFTPLASGSAESMVAAVEQALRLTITVRDLTGWLRGADGDPLLPSERNSHRRQPVCSIGFAPACVQHCRHACTAALRKDGRTQATLCWKGLREVLVPVIRGGTLHGYLFAGAWRAGAPPTGAWSSAWRRLPTWDVAAAGQATALLGILADSLWTQAERARSAGIPGDRAGRIRAFIHADPARGRAGLARHLGLSPSRTSHLVNELCGCSVQDLVIAARITAAQRLLATTDLPTAVIGSRVGWHDPPHFSRMFRQRTGLPPGRWRDVHSTV